MSLTAIIVLIALALILLVIEILFVPGMILGSISVIMMLVGVFLTYKYHGDTYGHVVLACTAVLGIGLTWWAFKSDVWTKVAVNSSVEGKANLIEHLGIAEGDVGTTISRLAPMGKALINSHTVEVSAYEGFIDQNSPVTVYKISSSKIIVKLKS